MTEAEWMECEDPEPMLGFLIGYPTKYFQHLGWVRKDPLKASDRKFRLFAIACYRAGAGVSAAATGRRILAAAEEQTGDERAASARLREELREEAPPLGLWSISDEAAFAAWMAHQPVIEFVIERVEAKVHHTTSGRWSFAVS